MKRALISVFDKEGIVPLAKRLADMDVEIVSSGGTAKALEEAGIAVTDVKDVTGVPEMLSHRVVTLHPKIHGGILADLSKEDHLADLAENGIEPFQLVVTNLYPFATNPSIEMIDIGGPALIRAAAKNHEWVAVVTSKSQYGPIEQELADTGEISLLTRKQLATQAFGVTAAYDREITNWLEAENASANAHIHLDLGLDLIETLRYGENPHQSGALYKNPNGEPDWIANTVQVQGKEMSFINWLDVDAGYRLVSTLVSPSCVVIKHANPAGVAVGENVCDAYLRALSCDELSAFGGVIALNTTVDAPTATEIAQRFTEVVIAPDFDQDALSILGAKKNVRVLCAPLPTETPSLQIRSIGGSFLVQGADQVSESIGDYRVVTNVEPTREQMIDLDFAWKVCAATSSNAIVLAKDLCAFGIGAGQQSRVHAAEIAAKKAAGRAAGGVCASDAFFPFRDGVDTAVQAGASAIIQPGGSKRDDEVIAAANEWGVAMVFTGKRHFRH